MMRITNFQNDGTTQRCCYNENVFSSQSPYLRAYPIAPREQGVIMAGRGPQTFNKRQKEQKRKEKQQEKLARRAQRQQDKLLGIVRPDDDSLEDGVPGLESPLDA